MTNGYLKLFKDTSAFFRLSIILKFAVGILYFSQSSFVNILEPSSFEANLLGPKTFIFVSKK